MKVQSPKGELEKEEVNELASGILNGDDYQLDKISPENVEDLVSKFFGFIDDLFAPVRNFGKALHDASPVAFLLLVTILIIITVALLSHVIYSVTVTLRAKSSIIKQANKEQKKLTYLDVQRQADEAKEEGDYVLAIRLLSRAILLRIHEVSGKAQKLGMTNRDYLRLFKNTPVFDQLRKLIRMIDLKWYGDQSCSVEDYEVCRHAYEDVLKYLNGVKDAQ